MNNNNDGITFLSEPMQVNMADDWYSHVSAEHFWIKRRQNVLLHLLKNTDAIHARWLDVGCGSGIFQQFLVDKFQVKAFGADLNIYPLRMNPAEKHLTLCYDINDRNPSLEESFDVVSILDVIEHIEDDETFLDSILFHLKPGGLIIGNVPAFNLLFSRYDTTAGHQRRYSIKNLKSYLGARESVSLEAWTYWGMSLLPVLLLRTLLTCRGDDAKVMRTGFLPPNRLAEKLLDLLSRLERLDNTFFGTSLAFIFRKNF
jgi:SAM-dependent methyltransferase